jgi:4,5-dihydroxyphthalate decarboxylase
VTLSLTLACWDYDRTAALADGRVRPEGVDLTYLDLPVEETFFRMLRFAEFDVAELSLSSYVISMARGAPFVAIPVFPSRAFRHNGVYVRAGAGIEAPQDLVGRRVGVPEYQMSAAVWIRGILADHYGVPVGSVTYRTGGLHDPGRHEKLPIDPPGVKIEPIPPGETLAGMLVRGEIDALYSPRVPRPFLQGDLRVHRLWPDAASEEKAYVSRTGIFPIMHLVAIRRDVYEANRWVARSLYKAFEEAKAVAEARLEETAAPANLLPWSYQEVRETKAVMGEDFWPYGLEANLHTLGTFLRYSHEQGLADRLYEPSELFCPEAGASAVV